MSIDPAEVAGLGLVGLIPIALSLTFFYAVTPLDHRWVVKGRRAILKNDYQRWPFRNAMPGLLPIGIGIELLLVGRVTEGRPWTLDQLPADPPQAVLAAGLVWFMVGFFFMIHPPRWVLPAWYRTVELHRKTLPAAAVVMALDFASEIGATRASVEAVMASAQAERSGVAASSLQSPADLMSEAVTRLDELTAQVNDRGWFRLVGAWRAAFSDAATGPGSGFASALAVASDSDWLAFDSASNALLARLKTLHDAISRDLPQL